MHEAAYKNERYQWGTRACEAEKHVSAYLEFVLEYTWCKKILCFRFEGTIIYDSFNVAFTAFTSLIQNILMTKFWSVVYSLYT